MSKLQLQNKTFGKITALYPTDKRDRKGRIIWKCRCTCGNEFELAASRVSSYGMCAECKKENQVSDIYKNVCLAKEGNLDALQFLFDHYKPLIKKQIDFWSAVYPPTVNIEDDLYQVGRIAIYKTVCNYPPSEFSLKVSRLVTNAVKKEIIRFGTPISLGTKHKPDLKQNKISFVRRNSDFTQNYEFDLEEFMYNSNLVDIMNKVLTPRELDILTQYVVYNKSKTQLGAKYQISSERVRQILATACRKVKKAYS